MTSKSPPEIKAEPQPGDGIRSMQTSKAFRVINFELYAKPNLAIMAVGVVAFLGCSAYIAYMRYQWKERGYVTAIKPDGKEQFVMKKSKWD